MLKHHTDRRRMIGASQKLDIDFKAVASTKHSRSAAAAASGSGDVKFSGATIVSPSDGHTPHPQQHVISVASPHDVITPSAAAGNPMTVSAGSSGGGGGGGAVGVGSASGSGAGVAGGDPTAINSDDSFDRMRAPSTASQFGTSQFGPGRNSIALSSTADFADDPRMASPPSSFAQITAAVQAKAGKAARR